MFVKFIFCIPLPSLFIYFIVSLLFLLFFSLLVLSFSFPFLSCSVYFLFLFLSCFVFVCFPFVFFSFFRSCLPFFLLYDSISFIYPGMQKVDV